MTQCNCISQVLLIIFSEKCGKTKIKISLLINYLSVGDYLLLI